jgi:aspartyl-tRNA(Asn)/glutamyl-tRNA(Gln) amidotransferase subunit B
VSIDRLAEIIRLEASGQVSNTAARQLFTMLETSADDARDLQQIANDAGLLQVSEDGALVGWIDAVFAENPNEATRFMAGEKKLQGVLVGLVMRKSGGAADPRKVNQLLAGRVG